MKEKPRRLWHLSILTNNPLQTCSTSVDLYLFVRMPLASSSSAAPSSTASQPPARCCLSLKQPRRCVAQRLRTKTTPRRGRTPYAEFASSKNLTPLMMTQTGCSTSSISPDPRRPEIPRITTHSGCARLVRSTPVSRCSKTASEAKPRQTRLPRMRRPKGSLTFRSAKRP